VPVNDIAARLPRVVADFVDDLPTSGTAEWGGASWLLQVDAREPWARQGATLAHELAHVIYHQIASVVVPELEV